MEEGIAFRNENVSYNVAKRCLITNNNTYTRDNPYSGGVWIFGCDDYNVTENTKIEGVYSAIGYRGDAGESTNDDVGNNNLFRNIIIDDCRNVFYLSADADAAFNTNNTHYHLTANGCVNFIALGNASTVSNFNIKNSIFNSVTNVGSSTYAGYMTFVNNNFYSSWTTGTGTGSTNVNPSFINTVDFVPQTTMGADRIEGVYYDYDGEERGTITTKGAQRIEVVEEPPVGPPTYTPDYYVSSSTGSDSNDGLTELTAWASISKVQSTRATWPAGSVVAFKKGDSFNGRLYLSNTTNGTPTDPIVFSSYGTGAKPKLSVIVAQTLTWINKGGNIWYNTTITYDPQRIKIGGVEVLKGEYSELGTTVPDQVIWTRANVGDGGTYLYVYSVAEPTNVQFANQSRQLYLDATDNLVFNDLEFEGGYYENITVAACTNIKFEYCDIGGMAYNGVFTSGACTNIDIDHCNVDSKYTFDYSTAGVESLEFRGCSDGIWYQSCDGGDISNNTVTNWAHAGIQMLNVEDSLISTNIKIFGNTVTAPDIIYGAGIGLGIKAEGNEIYNNYMIDNAGHSSANGIGNHWHHNIFKDIRTSPIKYQETGYGLVWQNTCEDNIVEHNIFINCESGGFKVFGGTSALLPVTNNILRNNIIYECGTGNNNSAIVFWDFPYNDGNFFYNNDIYSSSTTSTIDYYETFMTVATFDALVDGRHTHSGNISGNPTFVNAASDYHLQAGSPARNAGTPALSTLDYEGNTMSVTTPDIGIYEHL